MPLTFTPDVPATSAGQRLRALWQRVPGTVYPPKRVPDDRKSFTPTLHAWLDHLRHHVPTRSVVTPDFARSFIRDRGNPDHVSDYYSERLLQSALSAALIRRHHRGVYIRSSTT